MAEKLYRLKTLMPIQIEAKLRCTRLLPILPSKLKQRINCLKCEEYLQSAIFVDSWRMLLAQRKRLKSAPAVSRMWGILKSEIFEKLRRFGYARDKVHCFRTCLKKFRVTRVYTSWMYVSGDISSIFSGSKLFSIIFNFRDKQSTWSLVGMK